MDIGPIDGISIGICVWIMGSIIIGMGIWVHGYGTCGRGMGLCTISLLFTTCSHSQQCQRLFQVNTPVTSMCLHPNQSTLVVADQGGTIYVWDLSTDHNEQHVRTTSPVYSSPHPGIVILYSYDYMCMYMYQQNSDIGHV